MAIRHIDRDDVPLKAYLRADPYSQIFNYKDNGEGLVTQDMFWGKNDEIPSIYLDYSKINNKSIEVSEGISEYTSKQVLNGNACDKWIQNNILNGGISRLYVIQGYAGCGKTTFIQHLKRSRSDNFREYYIDIGADWSYSIEPYMFYDETMHELNRLLLEISSREHQREEIWKNFTTLGLNTCSKSLDLNIMHLINRCIALKEGATWENLISKIIDDLNENYSERKNPVPWKPNIGLTPTIISVIILLICAISISEDNSQLTYSLIFDNLDVITNPAIPAGNVMNLWGVIDNYLKFKQMIESETDYKLPNIQILISVRKVLYSHIVSHLPVLEMPANLNYANINVCDISNLYPSKEVMSHRIKYWEKNSNSLIRDKMGKLKLITIIHNNESTLHEETEENDYDLKTDINIDAFLNHNYRAFSNIHATLIDDDLYFSILTRDFNRNSTSKAWQKVATITFLISLMYRKEKVWTSLGFGCKDFDSIDYPTTYNRLILNYLFLAKRGRGVCKYTDSEIKNIPDNNYVSLYELQKTLNKAVIFPIKNYYSYKQIDEQYYDSYNTGSENLLIERLADMCARNPMDMHSKALGYDSDDDELWRRPLYFKGGVRLNHTASSSQELKDYFLESTSSNKSKHILFSITDEGFVLIRDFVASFEFYSARYCAEEQAKPLHQVVNVEEIDNIIEPVYFAIRRCCKRNKIFERQYSSAYGITKRNDYLSQFFHPRTNPHYSTENRYIELKNYSFRPQLHIVRVIYNHIFYFDSIKEMISLSDNNAKNEMCECLTGWIESYLNLYSQYFFEIQKNTICQPDNNVCKDLRKQLKKQKDKYSRGDYRNVKIRVLPKKNKKRKFR